MERCLSDADGDMKNVMYVDWFALFFQSKRKIVFAYVSATMET